MVGQELFEGAEDVAAFLMVLVYSFVVPLHCISGDDKVDYIKSILHASLMKENPQTD